MMPYCPFSGRRVWPAAERGRTRCPHCTRRVVVVRGTILNHRLPAVKAA